MKPLFIIHTTYYYDLYREYIYLSSTVYRSILKETLMYTAFCVMAVLCVYSITSTWTLSYYLFIPLLMILLWIKYETATRMKWKKEPYIQEGTTVEIRFYEDHLEHRNPYAMTSVPYTDVETMIEGRRGVYLMLNMDNGILLEKSQISLELMDFLRSRIVQEA